MKKRVISLIMALVLSLSVATVAFATELPGEENSFGVAPQLTRYYYTIATSQDISISSARATCSSTVVANSSVTRIEIYMYLERLDGSTWVTVNQWNGSFDSTTAVMSEKSWVFVTGRYFRTRCFYKVYSGIAYESFTNYSQTIYY